MFYLSPFITLHDLAEDCTTFSRPFIKEGQKYTPQPFYPRMDLHENQESNTVTAVLELPGLKSEDLTIEVHQNRLIVSGEFKKIDPPKESGYLIHGRRQGKFSRTIILPAGVKPDDVNAKMENGLLTITFPLVTPEQQPHRVTIS